jgi:hypothetical protein
LPQFPNLNSTQQLTSTQVIIRFCVRMIILIIFAAFGSIGFDRSLTALLWMATVLSAMLATLWREEPLDSVLNHWDETMAYAALCCLAIGFDHSVAS